AAARRDPARRERRVGQGDRAHARHHDGNRAETRDEPAAPPRRAEPRGRRRADRRRRLLEWTGRALTRDQRTVASPRANGLASRRRRRRFAALALSSQRATAAASP